MTGRWAIFLLSRGIFKYIKVLTSSGYGIIIERKLLVVIKKKLILGGLVVWIRKILTGKAWGSAT